VPYAKLGFAKLYDKTPITAAEMLNDRVLPFYEEQGIVVSRVLTDRGTEYCGNPQSHEYELYLAVENIDHTRTKARSPQTNGICERFNKTILEEFYQVAMRKKIYRSSRNCRPISMSGCETTTPCEPTRDAGVMAKPRCRRSLTRCRWQSKSCCKQREQRHQIFVGHPPGRRPDRQVKSILLQMSHIPT
jgi:hypothetical protein